jgi:hypothetical protein
MYKYRAWEAELTGEKKRAVDDKVSGKQKQQRHRHVRCEGIIFHKHILKRNFYL